MMTQHLVIQLDSARIDAYTLANSGHWDPAQTTKTMSEYIDDVAVPQVKELLTNPELLNRICIKGDVEISRPSEIFFTHDLTVQLYLNTFVICLTNVL